MHQEEAQVPNFATEPLAIHIYARFVKWKIRKKDVRLLYTAIYRGTNGTARMSHVLMRFWHICKKRGGRDSRFLCGYKKILLGVHRTTPPSCRTFHMPPKRTLRFVGNLQFQKSH